MDKDIENLAARRQEALAEGRAAEKAGRSINYIHGRPYADPAGAASASSEGTRSPAMLARHDDGSDRLRDIESDNASMMTLVENTAENMAFIRNNLSRLAAQDRGAVEAAYGRILAEAAADRRQRLAPRKRELDMDL